MLEAVIFDVDGVLVDSYRAHFESWRALAAGDGIAAARAAGMAAVALASTGRTEEVFAGAGADLVVRSLRQLGPEVLRSLGPAGG